MKKRNRGSRPSRRPSRDTTTVPTDSGLHHWREFRWLREYRFLAVILALSLPLGLYESIRGDLPTSNAEVRREWLFDTRVDLASTLVELYPNRSLGHFFRGYQASMCWDTGFDHEVCQQFANKDPRDIRIALEEAIRHGATNEEELLHFYAFVLVQLGESPEIIDDAVRRWRTNYPYSTKPDPRQM